MTACHQHWHPRAKPAQRKYRKDKRGREKFPKVYCLQRGVAHLLGIRHKELKAVDDCRVVADAVTSGVQHSAENLINDDDIIRIRVDVGQAVKLCNQGWGYLIYGSIKRKIYLKDSPARQAWASCTCLLSSCAHR